MNRERWYTRLDRVRTAIWHFDIRRVLCRPLDWALARLACCHTCNDYHAPHCAECDCHDCIPF